MIDSLMSMLSPQFMAFGVLVMACTIVVTEAVASSRHVLWGDLFFEDADD